MPISLISTREPQLLSSDKRCPSAEMQTSRNKTNAGNTSAPIIKQPLRFNEVVSIRSTTHINDMTDEEVADAWFSRKEMMAIKRSLANELRYMTEGNPWGPNMTMRGLEFRTKIGGANRKANKLEGIHSILDEQDRQYLEGFNDPEMIRQVNTNHSKRCAAAAQAFGRADEHEMRLNIKEDEQNRELMKDDIKRVEIEIKRAEIKQEIKKEYLKKVEANTSKPAAKSVPSIKKNKLFGRLFSKKKAVLDEIKQLKIGPPSA